MSSVNNILGNIDLYNKNSQNNRIDSDSNIVTENKKVIKEEVENTASKLSLSQTVSGKIMDIKGDEATINIQGTVVNAKIENAINLQPGQTVLFSLKPSSNDQIVLSPLYTNMESRDVALKALSDAGIPATNNSVRVTETMINEGLSINKDSLSNMVHLSENYPDTSIKNLADMQKLGLEINKDTVEQFTAFKNYESKISDDLLSITDKIPETVNEMFKNGNNEDAAKFLSDVIKVFSAQDSSGANQIVVAPGEANAQTVTVGTPTKVMLNTDIQGLGDNGESIIREKMVITEDNLVLKPQDVSKTVDEYQEVLLKESVERNEEFRTDVQQPLTESQKNNLEITMKVSDAWQSLGVGEKEQIVDVLKQSGLDENQSKYLASDKATQNDFLEATGSLLLKGGISDSLKNLVMSEGFSDILKSQMQSQLFLAPIDVNSKETVEGLYKRLDAQTRAITDALSELSYQSEGLSDSLSNMSNNLDFMQQMNQMAQYIQLPLKMNGSEATGDLYVYTDKKSLAENKGSVSALLHLDMQNLGPMDVYASISPGNKVFTKFYLSSEEMIDFISANIHILNERLEKRGYSMKSETVMLGEKDERPMEPPILNEGIEKNQNTLIKKYGFDCFA